jgi:hypothetical protein
VTREPWANWKFIYPEWRRVGRPSRATRIKRRLRYYATGNRQRYRNWLNRRAVTRGKSPLPERLTRPLRSSAPVYRNRVNRATGRPHRDDRELGKSMDRSLAARTGRLRERRSR